MTNWAYIRGLNQEQFKDWLANIVECCMYQNCSDCPLLMTRGNDGCDYNTIYRYLREQTED